MMAIDESRPSLGERYTAASQSSNLKFSDLRAGDIDLIASAGLVTDTLGLTLFRLKNEYDGVRGPVDAARAWADNQFAQARDLRRKAAAKIAAKENEKWCKKALLDASQMQEAATGSLKTELVLVLSKMSTLRSARYAVGQFVADEAFCTFVAVNNRRQRVDIPDNELMILAGQVLDVFIEDRCGACEGRGFNGAGFDEQSGPVMFCRECKNSGFRRANIGRNDMQRLFSSHLLSRMDEMFSVAEKEIRAAMPLIARRKQWIIDTM